MEENLNSFIDIKKNQGGLQPIVLTQHHPLCRKPSSPHEKLRSPNTMMLQQETNSTSSQDMKFQPLDPWG